MRDKKEVQVIEKLKQSIINSIDQYVLKGNNHYSFKYILRYIKSGQVTCDNLTSIKKNLSSKQKNFQAIINLLATLDWPQAEKYFTDNPQEIYCGSKQGSIFSYIKFENEIYRRDVFKGLGGFGKVKTAKSKAGEEIIIKRQTLRQDDKDFEENRAYLIQEAVVNEDVGLAKSKLFERKNITQSNGTVHKVYQGVINRGESLFSYLKNQDSVSPHKRLDYAIQLLLEVSRLHTGHASQSGKCYAHRDIKPENVCLDKDGKIHLIDFGMAESDNLTQSHKANCGTKSYQPRDLDLRGKAERTVVTTPSYFFDDKIACLRTIFYPPKGLDSLLLESQYNALPPAIQSVLDTKYIKTCLKHDYGLKNIAAVLIFYLLKPLCAPEEVQKILKDNDVAEKIVNIYSSMTAEQKTKWLSLSDDNVFYLSDILRSGFLENIDNISTLNQKLKNQNITSFDKLTEFLSSENLTPEAFSLHISKLSLENFQAIIDSMLVDTEDNPLHQAIENLKVQGDALLDRGHAQAAKAIWAVYIQLRQKSPLTEEYINQITAPHQEILQVHRGSFEIINWIKDFIRKAVFTLTQYSIFRTKTEKLLDPIHQEISNATKTK